MRTEPTVLAEEAWLTAVGTLRCRLVGTVGTIAVVVCTHVRRQLVTRQQARRRKQQAARLIRAAREGSQAGKGYVAGRPDTSTRQRSSPFNWPIGRRRAVAAGRRRHQRGVRAHSLRGTPRTAICPTQEPEQRAMSRHLLSWYTRTPEAVCGCNSESNRAQVGKITATMAALLSLVACALGIESTRYGIVFDAGSSGTRIHVYKWKTGGGGAKDAFDLVSDDLLKIKPGLSAFKEKTAEAGSSLEPLIAHAKAKIPAELVPSTPVFLMATAGLRMVGESQGRHPAPVCNWLSSSGFLFRCEWATVLDGGDEASSAGRRSTT